MSKSAIYLSNIVNNLPHFIFWKDHNSHFAGCNQLFAEAAGLTSPVEIIGKTDYDMPWKAKAAEYIQADQMIMSQGLGKNSYEEEQPQQDGSVATMLVSKVPIYDPLDNIVGLLGIYMNITERKMMEKNLRLAKEKAEIANEAKQIFLENMRHDLRTPFSGILTLSEWMATQEIEPSKRDNLECIAQSARLLLSYINLLLQHAKQGVRPQDIAHAPMNLYRVIQDAMLMLKPKTLSKSLALTLNYPSSLPRIFDSCATSVKRIILNVLGNAVKFTSEGKISVEVTIAEQRDDVLILSIAISDSGIGIPPEKREIIFEKFTRLEAAAEGKYDGMGLGLYDVKNLCRNLGGDISVSSNHKQGTTFTCLLPFKLSNEDFSPIQTDAPHEVKFMSDKKLKILLVEDQSIAAHAAKIVLSAEDYIVDIANDGKSAIEQFKTNRYDLVLLDIGLPDINGFSLAKNFRELETTLNYSPSLLIALTAHEENEKNNFSHFDSILNKPFSINALHEVFSNIHHCKKENTKS